MTITTGDIQRLVQLASEAISQAAIDLDNGADRSAHREIHDARMHLEDACSLLLWRLIQPPEAGEEQQHGPT